MRSVLVLVLLVFPLLAGCLTNAEPADSEPIPAAMPHQGDKGLYTLLKAPLSEEARQQGFSEDRFLNISFEFEGTSVYHDVDGKAHAAWDLLVQVTDEQLGPWVFSGGRFHVDPDTFQVLGTDEIRHRDDAPRVTNSCTYDPEKCLDPGSSPKTRGSEDDYTSTYSYFRAKKALPCGLLESWLGGYFPLPGRTVPATVDCSWGRSRWNQEAHGIIVRVQAEDEPPFVVVEHHITYVNESLNTPAPEWRAWYVEGNPYPVRLQDLVGGNFGAPGDELVLIEFERGTSPFPTIPLGALRDLPPLVEAPLTPWTIPDSGLQHPWSLGKAFAYARDDSDSSVSRGFREFLEQHPDAYIAFASHSSSDVDGIHLERWEFAAVDGTEHYYVSIVREQRLGLQEPMRYGYDNERYGTLDWLQDNTWPAKELLPRQMATPESLLAIWEIAVADAAHPAASPSYSFYIRCWQDCNTTYISQTAGVSYYHREGGENYPIFNNYQDVWDNSGISISSDGLDFSWIGERSLQFSEQVPAAPTYEGPEHVVMMLENLRGR